MLTPQQLQIEQQPWVMHNFGPGQPHQPLLGMFEELGELEAALESWNIAEIKDALADFSIFAADYSTKMGWNFGGIFPNLRDVLPARELKDALTLASRACKKVAHHQLKSEQKIRGTNEAHNQAAAHGVREALTALESFAAHFGWTLMELAEPVWAKVKLRDFKKNALTGGA